MARSGFSVRFGYGRWLRHLVTGEPPSFAGIGDAIGRVGQTVSGWSERDEATDSRRDNRALAEYFGVTEDWLVDGEGAPPHPELWATWLAAREAHRHPVKAIETEAKPFPRSSVKKRRRTGTGKG